MLNSVGNKWVTIPDFIVWYITVQYFLAASAVHKFTF
jgi:hypothetical protein